MGRGGLLSLSPASSVVRLYDQGSAADAAPFRASVTVLWLSPTTVCLSNTIGQLTRADLIAIRAKLREQGATQALIWRRTGRTVPTGTALFSDGPFTVYRVPLAEE